LVVQGGLEERKPKLFRQKISSPEIPDPFNKLEVLGGVHEPFVGGDKLDFQLIRKGYIMGIIGRGG